MSHFLSTMTETGRELVARIRDARTADDIATVSEMYRNGIVAGLLGGHVLSDADQFAIACALGRFLPGSRRERARHWEAAAMVAIRKKAHAEALAALQEAEKYGRSKDRQRWIGLLREILVTRGDVPAPAVEGRPRQLKPSRAVRT